MAPTAAGEAQGAASGPADPYSLDPQPDDAPGLARLKAAFRLLAAFREAELICRQCGLGEIMNGYARINGQALGQAVAAIRQGKGLTDEWKRSVALRADAGVAQAFAEGDCGRLGQRIREGEWDLHKGEHEDDYLVMKGR
jgi:hypothetical protein